MKNEPWYTVKCLFYDVGNRAYEERIVLIEAENFQHAVTLAENEAKTYCENLRGIKYYGCIDIFHLFDQQITSGVEVFSATTKSDLTPENYIKHMSIELYKRPESQM